ncbi:MAG TPA: hypothetical protein VF723_12240 [Pyrinomonadaceae bacterium]|jgi:hypothetical protein
MSLVEDNQLIEFNEADFADTDAAIRKWQDFPASSISDHGEECCRMAREWVFSMDYSLLNAGNSLTGPRWLRQKHAWGPSSWPLYWCEAVKQEMLDCGALAALSHEIFRARGVQSYPAQLIHQYTEHATSQWFKRWNGDESSVHWVAGNLIYHEGCAVVTKDREIKVWDSTATWWVNPKQFGGYGGVLVLRIVAPDADPATSFNWGTHRIVPNQWQKIERSRAEA